jgi:hypothetical protein
MSYEVVSDVDKAISSTDIDDALDELRNKLTIPLDMRFGAMSNKFLQTLEQDFQNNKIVGRRFVMYRPKDKSGVSGEGIVTIGVETPSGTAIVEWLNDLNNQLGTTSNGFAVKPGPDGIDDLIEVHGHQGGTVVVYLDG